MMLLTALDHQPLGAVTVSDTEYVPSDAYVCVGAAKVLVDESPKSHRYVTDEGIRVVLYTTKSLVRGGDAAFDDVKFAMRIAATFLRLSPEEYVSSAESVISTLIVFMPTVV